MPFKKGETPKGAKPFKKGKTGNPNGRPKKLPALDDLLADIMSRPQTGPQPYGEPVTQAEAIILSLVKQAKKGNVRAAEVLLDRSYGKAVQPVTGSFTGNLIMQFDDSDADLGNSL